MSMGSFIYALQEYAEANLFHSQCLIMLSKSRIESEKNDIEAREDMTSRIKLFVRDGLKPTIYKIHGK